MNRKRYAMKGVLLMETIIGLTIMALVMPLLIKNLVQINNIYMKNQQRSSLLFETIFLETVIRREWVQAQTIEYDQGYLLIEMPDKRVSYYVKNNRVAREVNGKSLRYMTALTQYTELLYHHESGCLELKSIDASWQICQ